MRNIKHDRPELRYKDNIRREIEKAARQIKDTPQVDTWPAHIQPLAQNPKALEALASFLNELDAWVLESDLPWTPSQPPKNVKDSFAQLKTQRIVVPYSDGLKVEDWLAEPIEANTQRDDIRPFLKIFRDLWK